MEFSKLLFGEWAILFEFWVQDSVTMYLAIYWTSFFKILDGSGIPKFQK